MAVMVFIFMYLYRRRTNIYEACKSQCVYVCTNEGYGRGVVFEINNDEIVIATALHVSRDWGEGSYIRFVDGTRAFGQRFGADEYYDVEFISVPLTEALESTIEKLKTVRVDEESKELPLECVCFDDEARIDGKVLSMDEYMYEFDKKMMYGNMKVGEGMSGAPVFDTSGNFLGLVLAGNENGVFAAVKYENIKKCLDNKAFGG